MLQTISITISGKVQGVFFRQSTKEIANQLGITGQVKNIPGEKVHIIATGTKEQLDIFITWCKKGPPRAVVAGVEAEQSPLQIFHQFIIVR